MIIRLAPWLLGAALLACIASACVAQDVPRHQIALYEIAAKAGALKVTSPGFSDGAALPIADTQFGRNYFPGLNWSAGPADTRSYVVLMQDSNELLEHGPMLHWTLFNIPPGQTSLPAGLTSAPAGSHYGPSYLGAVEPYAGPAPGPGFMHHYHFEVFALDEVLPTDITNGGFTALRAAMTSHVLASGQIVATFQR